MFTSYVHYRQNIAVHHMHLKKKKHLHAFLRRPWVSSRASGARVEGPSVHYDARLDPGRGAWHVLQSREIRHVIELFFKRGLGKKGNKEREISKAFEGIFYMGR